MGCGAAKDIKAVEPVDKKDSLPGVNENEESSIRKNSQTLNEGPDDDQMDKDSWVLSGEGKDDDAIMVSEHAKISHESILGAFTAAPLPTLATLTASNRAIGLTVYSEAELEKLTKDLLDKKASTKKGAAKRPRAPKEVKGTFYGELAKGARNGNGMFIWDDEYYGEGTWKDEIISGPFNLCFSGKALPLKLDAASAATHILIYQGDVKNDKLDGKGILIT